MFLGPAAAAAPTADLSHLLAATSAGGGLPFHDWHDTRLLVDTVLHETFFSQLTALVFCKVKDRRDD